MTPDGPAVLVVDDEIDFAEILTLRLREAGENALLARSGRECLEMLKHGGIEVVILDVRMPDMDGIQTLAAIKQAAPLVEVILLTGHGTVDTAVRGMKLGAYDLLIKPADFQELREKLNQARRRRREQLERIRNAEAALRRP